MVGVLVSLGALGLLVWRGTRKAQNESRSEESARRRLTELKARTRVTLDEAEDAVVLARRLKDAETVKRFLPIVMELRKKRVSI